MTMIFLDANIFIRFLTKDDRKKAEDVRKLFELIESGRIKAQTHIIVLAEIVWTLHSFFKVKKETIAEYITLLFDLKNLAINDEKIISRAIETFKNRNIDFIDAFCASLATEHQIKYICSYDRDFDKIKDIKRIEPRDLI
ncbi:MAG TPA: PIN domain-containing protein [Candidatus Paceibacterota bacterium]